MGSADLAIRRWDANMQVVDYEAFVERLRSEIRSRDEALDAKQREIRSWADECDRIRRCYSHYLWRGVLPPASNRCVLVISRHTTGLISGCTITSSSLSPLSHSFRSRVRARTHTHTHTIQHSRECMSVSFSHSHAWLTLSCPCSRLSRHIQICREVDDARRKVTDLNTAHEIQAKDSQ